MLFSAFSAKITFLKKGFLCKFLDTLFLTDLFSLLYAPFLLSDFHYLCLCVCVCVKLNCCTVVTQMFVYAQF